MKLTQYALAAVLVMSSSIALARGDGYNKSHEAQQRFRENQERIHGKQPPAPHLETSQATPKPQADND